MVICFRSVEVKAHPDRGVFPLWQRSVGQLEQSVGNSQQLRDGIGIVGLRTKDYALIRQFTKAFPVRGHSSRTPE
jgi:hypothetical protein